MTWSKTSALGWSGFHGSSTNLSVKYSTLAIPTDSLLYTGKWGCILDALGRSGKEKSQFMIGGNSKSKATLICPVVLTSKISSRTPTLVKTVKKHKDSKLYKATDTLPTVQGALNTSISKLFGPSCMADRVQGSKKGAAFELLSPAAKIKCCLGKVSI